MVSDNLDYYVPNMFKLFEKKLFCPEKPVKWPVKLQ